MVNAAFTMNTKIERAIVRALVEECTAAGFPPVQVWNQEEYIATPDIDTVLTAIFDVYGTPTIHFGDPNEANRGVLIVRGNGEDCISDWHCGDGAFNAAVERACAHVEAAELRFVSATPPAPKLSKRTRRTAVDTLCSCHDKHVGEHPKCPKCTTEATRRVRRFGRPLGKQWHCLYCKHRWDGV